MVSVYSKVRHSERSVNYTKSRLPYYIRCLHLHKHLKPTHKYIHYYSCNFEVHSDLAGDTPEEDDLLAREALSILKTIVEQGEPDIEFYTRELAEDVLE